MSRNLRGCTFIFAVALSNDEFCGPISIILSLLHWVNCELRKSSNTICHIASSGSELKGGWPLGLNPLCQIFNSSVRFISSTPSWSIKPPGLGHKCSFFALQMHKNLAFLFENSKNVSLDPQWACNP